MLQSIGTPLDGGDSRRPKEEPLCSECGGLGIYHFPGCSELNKKPKLASKYDPVNHPSHYTSYSGLEVIDLTEQMNFCRGNAVKYICRAGKKSKETEVQDLEKAIWYLNREIERIKKNI